MKLHFVGLTVAMLAAAPAVAQTYQMSSPFNDNDAFTQAAIEWSKQVSEATGGEVQFEVIANSALAPMAETLETVSLGVIPAGMAAASFMSGTIPALGYVEMIGGLPITNPTTGEAVEAIWDDLNTLFAQHDVKPLWLAPAFSVGFICRDEFLTEAEHWQGKRVRTAGRWQSRQVEALGGVPVPLAPSELYVALQNGVVDCSLMIPSITTSARLYEVAPYYTDTDLPSNATIAFMNLGLWESFTDEQRAAIERVSVAMTQELSVSMRESALDDLEELAKVGEVYSLNEAERQEFLDATTPIFDEIASGVNSEAGAALVETLSAYR